MSSLSVRRPHSPSMQPHAQQGGQASSMAPPAAGDRSMWESRNADLIKQWLAFDPATQARAADEMGLAPVIHSGLLPNPEQLAQLVSTAQGLQGTFSQELPGLGVSDEMLTEAQWVLTESRIRVDAATDLYQHYEAQGSTGWGAAEGVGAEWMSDGRVMHGALQPPNPMLQKQANEAIGALDALIQQGQGAGRVALLAQQRLAHDRAWAWSREVDRYVQGREVGGQHAVEGLQTVRDESFDFVADRARKLLPASR